MTILKSEDPSVLLNDSFVEDVIWIKASQELFKFHINLKIKVLFIYFIIISV
jgi:hypothetical protein